MQKFCFSIRTRDGLPIARLKIFGKNQEEAERKLKQMYRCCEIVSCAADDQGMATSGRNTYIDNFTTILAKPETISG